MLKIDPGPFTLRELYWMRDGHDADVYMTHALLAAAANAFREKAIRISEPAVIKRIRRDAERRRPNDALKIAEERAEARALFEQKFQQRGD